MRKVAVIMSTYNGEKYIIQQIESILHQKKVEVELFIRDDGSSDGTLSILKKISRSNIHVTSGNNIGACASFIVALENVSDDYDYYAFSDQDDIWDEVKLLAAINILDKFDDNVPNLYYSNLNYVDNELNSLVRPKEKQCKDFRFSLVRSVFPGCTMVFNKRSLKLIKKYHPKSPIMHDQLIFQIVSGVNGNIYFDENSYINYRIHGNNVSDYKSSKTKRIKKLINNFMEEKNSRLLSLEELKIGYGIYMTKDNLIILNEIINYKNEKFLNRIKLGLSINDTIKYKIFCAVSMLIKIF